MVAALRPQALQAKAQRSAFGCHSWKKNLKPAQNRLRLLRLELALSVWLLAPIADNLAEPLRAFGGPLEKARHAPRIDCSNRSGRDAEQRIADARVVEAIVA